MKNTIIDDVYIFQFTKLMTIVNNTVNVINRRHTIIIINFFVLFLCAMKFLSVQITDLKITKRRAL